MEQFVVPADHARLAAMLGEKAGRMELTLAAADATEILVLVSAAALRAEGPTAVCLVVTDLTERHRHEAAIRRLNEELEGRVVERTGQLAAANWELVRAAEEAQRQKDLLAVTLASIGDGVIVTDAEGRVTFLNGEAERLTGWSNEEAAGQPLPAVFHIVNAETRQPVESPVEKVLRLGTVVGLANHTCLIARDGRETPIDDSGAAIRQNDGAVRGVVLVFRDFTEKKRAEEELELARTAAENANWAKSRFLANVSHELRTLMNAILGLIELALPKQADPTAADFLKTAKDSADLLLSLLNDLLDSAKIEAGKLELESVPFSLRRVLDQTAQVLGVRASEKGISFSCRIRPDVPDLLVGDQLRLRQVLLNLAGNGIKFTERGEVVLSVEPVQTVEGPADLSAPESEISNLGSDISSLQSPMCHLQFAVRDTGIGISAAELDHIFRPFAQADLSTARRFGGTGLGLTICSNLVAMMGGRLWAHSEVGRGSTFYFTVRLPLAAELPGEDQTPDVRAAAASQLRILLAEDNPANQKLATYILRSRGHTIDVAGDGQQALRMTQENHYDAILMDVQMSGMDGLEATAAIRKGEAETCRMPIIAMTAHAMKEDRERCLAAGMDGYLSKPIDAREMIALVERLAGAAGPSPDREERVAAPSAAAFDPASALKQCLSKPELLRQMIQIFIDDADNFTAQC